MISHTDPMQIVFNTFTSACLRIFGEKTPKRSGFARKFLRCCMGYGPPGNFSVPVWVTVF